MRRFAITLLLVSACGGAAVDTVPSTGEPVNPGQGPETTEAGAQTPPEATTAPDATTVPSATATTDSGRPVAPDFTLELDDGSSYTLSEGQKPVYLVFWAEW